MARKRKEVDRDALELEYRAGLLSLRVLGSKYGLAASRITQIAEEEGWVRDLSAKIQAKTESKLNRSLLNNNLNAEKRISERQEVDGVAQARTDIVIAHRKDIQRNRNLAMRMLEELEQTTDHNDLFEQLGELLHAPDEKGNDRRNELYRKVIDMPMRIDGVKKLAETLKVLVGLERQAFGLKDGDDDTNKSSYEDLLRSVLNG